MTIHARASGVLVTAVTALAALTASPALGGAPAAATPVDCDSSFNSLNALTDSALARGGERTEADTQSLHVEVPAAQLRVAGEDDGAQPPAGEHCQHPLGPAAEQGHDDVAALHPAGG